MTKKGQRNKTSTSRPPREIESTLIICSEKPKTVVRQIGSLTSIANYRLLFRDTETIHDLYFDTRDRSLQTRRLALRIREIGAMRWITLKGPSLPTDWGGVERLEIEEPWSQDALTRVVRELMSRKIKMPQQRQDFDYAHPLDVMMNLRLEIVQDRNTHRQVRNIVSASEESKSVLAELAIDSVVYHFSGQAICHHEVEIEVKVEDSFTVLKTVIESLVAMYNPALRRWHHGKLATGKAIENLLSEGALEGLLDIERNLKPVAYDKIDDYLMRGGI
ncbi:TPA: CYTH domain-containing protein [Candidatus Poribacteria bacterium]|nr:CYTH domain-containing protein [Candidatus Poribacteria bacterium]